MAYANHHPSSSQELIGFPPRSNRVIYRPVLPSILVFDPHSGVALQCHPSVIIQMDTERSRSLLQLMKEEGLMPSHEEYQRRKAIIKKLKETVHSWIQEVARERDLPEDEIQFASATILTYGSFGLGVYDSESDLDTLCVGPWFANIGEDFFVRLCDYLKNTHKVCDIHCIKSARVPLMRFKFEGISVDLTYAQLQVRYDPENLDLLNSSFLTNIDEVSLKSISGVRVNQFILRFIPNLENFKSLLRCVKFWAKRRGLYGNLFGYLGGIHLAIMSAFICQRSPNGGLSLLVMSFFDTFASWPWPLPVALHDGVQFREDLYDRKCRMPIRLPCAYDLCQSNVTNSTFNRIKGELFQGRNITSNLLWPDFDWKSLFEPFVYQKEYPRFLEICISTSNKDDLGDWAGLVKSRIRCLILKVEDILGFCDSNPTEYTMTGDTEAESSVIFYWGLSPGQRTPLNVEPVQQYFWRNITRGYVGTVGKVRLTVVQSFRTTLMVK